MFCDLANNYCILLLRYMPNVVNYFPAQDSPLSTGWYEGNYTIIYRNQYMVDLYGIPRRGHGGGWGGNGAGFDIRERSVGDLGETTVGYLGETTTGRKCKMYTCQMLSSDVPKSICSHQRA